MADPRRVVISGMGLVSALGDDEQTVWQHMLAGHSGIRTLSHLDTCELKTKIGGVVDRGKLTEALQGLRRRYTDLTADAAMLAADQALKQAGLIHRDNGYMPEPQQTACLIGSGQGCAESYFDAVTRFMRKGARGMRPTTVARCMPNAICSQIAIRYRLTGPNYMVSCACSSSTAAIGIAFRMIRDGYIDKALCGGADTIFDPLTFAAWDRLGMMTRNPDAATACRPYDRDRDGCVIGEGAAALVLEARDSAVARGARLRAELCGYGEASDATHLTHPNPEGQAQAIRAAMDCAGIPPEALGTINGHGTSTGPNDTAECTSVRLALGSAAADIPMASHTPYFGHLLGGAGVLETLTTVLTLETARIPPCLNLDNPDPACTRGIRLAAASPEPLLRPYALKNSFGFGGDNSVLVLRRIEA